VRLRALLFLLTLTAGDYLLWKWSIAGNHDILSLLAGCMFVPLAAISVYRLVLAGASLLSRMARHSSTTARAGRASRAAEMTLHDPRRSPHGPAAEPDSSPGRLAA
jgi:hypothetical protein